MSDLIKTLKSSSTGDDVYPNIKEDNIPTGAVTSAKIGTSAVTTTKINDGAVTTNKINDGAVNYDKLATALKNLIDGKASKSDLLIVQTALSSHTSNTSNPHNVTKSQVGLGNVDNTSDANKPISTATQTALDLKADKSTTYTKTQVDTALSGKASLTSNNTFTGTNEFNNSVYLPYETTNFINEDEDEYSLSQVIQNETNNKQDKLNKYMVYITLKNGTTTMGSLRGVIYSVTITPSEIVTMFNNNRDNFVKLFRYCDFINDSNDVYKFAGFDGDTLQYYDTDYTDASAVSDATDIDNIAVIFES